MVDLYLSEDTREAPEPLPHEAMVAGVWEALAAPEGPWGELQRLTEAGEEFQDYPDDQVHPHVQQKRGELEKAIAWVVDGLRKSGYTGVEELAKKLEQVPKLPSERVAPALQTIQNALHKEKGLLKKDARVGADPSNRTEVQHAAQAIEDALRGLPAIAKAASAISMSSRSDQGMWQTRQKGYVDDKTGEFRTLGKVVHPTGQDYQTAKDRKDAAERDARSQKDKSVAQRIQPTINPGKASPKAPVKPTVPPKVMQRIQPKVRKADDKKEGAWADLVALLG